MNYSQYLEQHQQLTQELDGASKEFEDLRSRYDSASTEERSNLESELKESMNKVETARSNLYSLESQNPQNEVDRASGVVPEEAIDWFEIIESASDLAKEALNYSKQTIAAVAMFANSQMADLPMDLNWETTPTVQSEQKPIEESEDIGEGSEGIETLRGGAKRRNEEMQEQVNKVGESSQIYDDSYANANVQSGEDILVQNDIDVQDYKTLMSDWNQEIESGIINTDDNMATLVNNANQNLYQKLTGESYEGSSEDLSHLVAEKLGEHFGIEDKNEFEQLNEKYVPQLESQQEQEQSQKISY